MWNETGGITLYQRPTTCSGLSHFVTPRSFFFLLFPVPTLFGVSQSVIGLSVCLSVCLFVCWSVCLQTGGTPLGGVVGPWGHGSFSVGLMGPDGL